MQCELKLELFPRVYVESFSAENHMLRQWRVEMEVGMKVLEM